MGTDRNSAIDANQIKNNTLTDDELSTTNVAVDTYVLSYDEATGKFTWVENTGGSGVTASEWDQNGFENLTDSTLTWTDTLPDRTLSIQPAVTSFDYWIAGVKYTSTGDTVQITDVEGVHFIYYDGDTLTVMANPTNTQVSTLIKDKALVSVVYWNATTSEGIYVGEERHGKSMSPYTHDYLHFSEGLRYISGLGLNTIDADQAGDDNAHSQFGVDLGIVTDEDLFNSISVINSTTGLPIYYMTGATPTWNKNTNAGYSVMKTGGSAEERLAYNQYTEGAWKLTEVSNIDFVLCHIFATTEKDKPMIAIVGQAVYTTKRAARTGAGTEIRELILNDILFPEIRPIATVIFQTRDSYTNAMKARIVTTADGDDYIDWRSEVISRVAISTTDHNSLTGLQGGTADEYYHLNSADYTELTEWLDNVTLGSDGKLTLVSGEAINEFSSDGTLAGDSDLAVPTEKAVKTYIDALVINDLLDVDFDSGTPADNDVLTYDNASGKWKAEASSGGTDEKAKVSSNDTTSGYLNGKLIQGAGITLTEIDDAGDETLSIINADKGSDAVGTHEGNYTHADIATNSGARHTQNTDTDLDATFEATFVKKVDTVNVLSDITSAGADIEDAVTKKHASGSDAETANSIGTLINSLDAKNTPIDADMVGLMDSASSNTWKKLSWAYIKATLKTYFDTLYGIWTLTSNLLHPSNADRNVCIGGSTDAGTSGKGVLVIKNNVAPTTSPADVTQLYSEDIAEDSTKLLLHCDGTDGSTTFTDSSGNGHTFTVVGTAELDTAYKEFGTASALFLSGTNKIYTADSPDWDFGTGDFTIDFWFRSITGGSNRWFLSRNQTADYAFYWQNGNLYFSINNVDVLTRSWTPTTATWYHMAVVRDSGSVSIYVDGIKQGASAAAATNLTYSSALYLGGWVTSDPDGTYWMDEIRISNTARWTANFTPPTSAYLPGAVSELKVRDEIGNVTTLSPHNFKNIPKDKRQQLKEDSNDLAWTYHSEKDGKSITVDMYNAFKALEKLTGQKFIYTNEHLENKNEADIIINQLKERLDALENPPKIEDV